MNLLEYIAHSITNLDPDLAIEFEGKFGTSWREDLKDLTSGETKLKENQRVIKVTDDD